MQKTVRCPLCGFSPSRLYDIDEETQSDQGNGKPKFECLKANGCGLMMQVESVELMRDVFRRLGKDKVKR